MERQLTVGILAHVDAGKTTLAEGILYTCKAVRKLGRVDHGEAFLDHFSLERSRGITIFSKIARVTYEDLNITLLDTPGHVDFSGEMERTLQVLDAAILVISATDGVQGHVETLWRLLKRYQIPTFLFINKMDLPGVDKEAVLQELQHRLGRGCVDFTQTDTETFFDAITMCDDALCEEFLEQGQLAGESLQNAIADRHIFPCMFGSALKLVGIDALLECVRSYVEPPKYREDFGARVFKIGRDKDGKRLTYLKVTGGSLQAKKTISGGTEEEWTEKVNEVFHCQGAKYEPVELVRAGDICAVTGLTKTFAGQGLGFERENAMPLLQPVLNYRVILSDSVNPMEALEKLKRLEEEEPLLHISWKEQTKEIHAQVMGEVQIQILQSVIAERFGMEVTFGDGSILYKETLAEPVVGIGHFEPLRHYAEVHLLLTPGQAGSGVTVRSTLSEDKLSKNWQRLILTHLTERVHCGVLTGSEVTDLDICLVAGRAHIKHTEGGDFRQATYRAVRQGLRKGKSVLLEPYYSFSIELPTEYLGRAMTDIKQMYGGFESPQAEGDKSILVGRAPVATLQHYPMQLQAYTGGRGRISYVPAGYFPCHNEEEVVAALAYDPEGDVENPTGSVFCKFGAGFVVPWYQVEEYAQVESEEMNAQKVEKEIAHLQSHKEDTAAGSRVISLEEIEEIFRQSYGKKPEDANHYRRYHKQHREIYGEQGVGTGTKRDGAGATNRRTNGEQYLLVDGYNIIFAWEELKSLAAVNLDSARDRLIDLLGSYQGYTGTTIIVVFDAYRVKGNPGAKLSYHNIHVVYTKEAETADQYIERTVHQIAKEYQVTVATSDALEQMIIWGAGAYRMSAVGLWEEIERISKKIMEEHLEKIGQENT